MSSTGSKAKEDDSGQAESQTAPPAKQSIFATSPFWSWIGPAFSNKRTMKTWIRCTAVLLAMMVLMVVQTTLNTMGNAAFFCVIVAFMLPPSMALQLYCFVALTLLVGMMLGWAWGIAAMAAANSVRSSSFLLQKNQELRSMLNPNSTVPIALQQQSVIFHGLYLEPRSSAIYGTFLFIGTFFFGFLRAKNALFTLMSIFATIVLDVMCSYGPSFPSNQFTIAKTFVIPALYCLAGSIASLVLIFPESMNHVWLTKLNDTVLTPIISLLEIQSSIITADPQTELSNIQSLLAKGIATRRAFVLGAQGLKRELGFVDLEISVGKLNSQDLKRIGREIEGLIPRVSALMAFPTYYYDTHRRTPSLVPSNSTPSSSEKDEKALKTTAMLDRSQTYHTHLLKLEETHNHTLTALLPKMAELSSSLRTTSLDGTKLLRSWIVDCNSGRWTGFFGIGARKRKEAREKRREEIKEMVKRLEDEWKWFREDGRRDFLSGYEKFFHAETGELLEDEGKFSPRTLFLCFTYSESLEGDAAALISILKLALELDEKRSEARIWFPTGLRHLGQKIFSSGGARAVSDEVGDPLSLGSSVDPGRVESVRNGDAESVEDESTLAPSTVEKDKSPKKSSPPHKPAEEDDAPRNPDARPPSTFIGRLALRLAAFPRFLRTPEGIFCLRHAFVSIALWIPSVCTTSAWFNYENRGLWALIMAQVSLAVYAGDQISSVVLRLGATIAGLLVGMAVWYMGSGSGLGNPYGITAATVVFSAPFLLGRIAAPPQYMMVWVLSGVTIIFVVGYSWVDNHVVQVSNAGVGVELAWKRALLVVIGFFAGFLVMLFPRVQSSRTLVRRTLAATTAEFGHVIRAIIEVLLAEERAFAGGVEKVDRTDDGGNISEARLKNLERITARLLGLAAKLQGLAPSLKTAQWEPQISGRWPQKEYAELFNLQTKLLSSTALLLSTLTRLEPKWCDIMVRKTPFMNPNFLSDFFTTFSMLSTALSQPHPLPKSFPPLRDRLIYHERFIKAHGGHPDLPKGMFPPVTPGHSRAPSIVRAEGTNSSIKAEDNHLHVDGSSIGIQDVTWGLLTDDQLPVHSTAIMSVSSIISTLDDVTCIIRDLCGSSSFHGFDELRMAALRREEEALERRGRSFV